MPNAFLRHLEHWLPAVLRAKTIRSASEQRLHFLGASDLATMLGDYVLTQLALNPTSCWTACELDQVSDDTIVEVCGFPHEMLAAALIGAVLELTPWQGDDGVAFLLAHDVPAEDAREFSAAVDVVADKLGARGQALIVRLSRPRPPTPATPSTSVSASPFVRA